MTTRPQPLEPLRRLLALGLLAVAVAGVPMALWWLGAAHLPDELPTWDQVTAALSGPDAGAVLLGTLVVVGWLAWGVFALAVAVELLAQVRGLPPLRLPGLAAPQQLAGLLVAAVLGAGAAPLLVTPALAGPPVATERPSEDPPAAPEAGPAPPPAAAPSAAPSPTAPAAGGPTYTVQPRDTLGRIAARQLGDWTRYGELLELNRGRPQPDGGVLTDPALIRPGWVLLLPPDAGRPDVPSRAAQVTVQPGDTLTGIAERTALGDWRPIFDLNAGEPLPGGGAFTDPDLLRPGQVLDLPPEAPAVPGRQPTPEEAPPPVPAPAPPTEQSPPPAPSPAPTGAPSDQPGGGRPSGDEGSGETGSTAPAGSLTPADQADADQADADQADADQADAEQPGDRLVAMLLSSGALLAAGIGTAWEAHRRHRLRRRRPGRRLTPVPAELSGIQTAVTTAADASRADYATLDHALRSLAARLSARPDGTLPDVLAAALDEHHLELRLHTAADHPPPTPWTADATGHRWFLELGEDRSVPDAEVRGRLAPFPTLVTIGTDRGRRWFLDLERVGVLRVAGTEDRREDLLRHLAAELAVNGWSDLLTVTTVGFAQELTELAPDRVQATASPLEPQVRDALRAATEQEPGDVLGGRLRATAGDGWMPHVLLAPHEREDGDLTATAASLRAADDRRPIAVVLGTTPTQDEDEWLVTLTEDGLLVLPALDLRLDAPRLTAQQARDIATLLAFERDTEDEAIPAAEGSRPWQARTDAAGALRPQPSAPPHPVTRGATPRRRDEPEQSPETPPPVSLASVPPAAADAAFEEVTEALREEVEADLDQLDQDLAEWWSPDGPRPRLTLLGPVTLRAHGDERAVIRSGLRRRYEEAVAYLATRPHGATVDEAATALQPARGGRTDPVSARAYVHRVTAGARAWLGVDPATGEKHLSPGHRGRYRLTNVLVDADLFRQLRARAAVRGEEGMPDLLAALRLVTGPPFAQRPSGYEWLDGLDFTLTAAVCDVAHQVITTALDRGDQHAARLANDAALLVAPEDEQVLLDAVEVAYRAGRRAEAETYVARLVAVHDGEDEMDLPLSTAEIVNRARRRYAA
jgi:nucleoid-associated protein YgaU/DNA-binding SARP family transcriptional activator